MTIGNWTLSPAARDYGRLRWDGGSHVHANGTMLRLTPGLYSGPSNEKVMSLFKNETMVQFYCDRFDGFSARNIVELGIHSGGSAIFFSELLKVEKFVGIELAAVAPFFDKYIERMGFQDKMHAYYMTDQGDAPRLTRIMDAEFGKTPLDMVLDDASHIYEPTLASFEVLFPLIRPGGFFVFEDWSWQALVSGGGSIMEQLKSNIHIPKVPLHNLLMELMLVSALDPELIAGIEINWFTALIKRGPKTMDGPLRIKEFLASKNCGLVGAQDG